MAKQFHHFTVADKGRFIKGSLRTITLKGVKGIELTSGKLKKDGNQGLMVPQHFMFDSSHWTEATAKKWMTDHDKKHIHFEPAAKKEQTEVESPESLVVATHWAEEIKTELFPMEDAHPEEEVTEAGISTSTNVQSTPGSAITSLNFQDAWDRMRKKKKKKDGEIDGGNGKAGNMGMVRPMMPKTEQEIVAEEDGWIFKGSLEWMKEKICDALKESGKYGDWPRIIATYKDHVKVESWISPKNNGPSPKMDNGENKFWEVDYTTEADPEKDIIVTLGAATEIEKKTQWIVKEQTEDILEDLFLFGSEEIEEAKWDRAFIDTLPDSSFAYVESGEKDSEGKTTPRSLRHLPYKDKDGKVDLPHLRNALARLPQTNLSADEKKKAQAKLDKAAKGADVGQ